MESNLSVEPGASALVPLLVQKEKFLDNWRSVCQAELGRSVGVEPSDFEQVFGRELTRLSDGAAFDEAFRSTAETLARRGVPLSSLLAISACTGRAAMATLGNDLAADTLRALNDLEAARARAYSGVYQTNGGQQRARCGPPLVTLRRTPTQEELEEEEYGIVGISDSMRRVRGAISVASRGPKQSVLILGESGSGKRLLARAIHTASDSDPSRFAHVSTAGLRNDLVESELFGHVENGSPEYAGVFRSADGGTVMFEEIGDVPPEIQAKLVRVLDERRVFPQGSREPIAVDVRIIAATQHDPVELVTRGLLRPELYERLRTFTIKLPPLRERRQDIPLLVEHFLRTFCHRHCGCIWGVSERALHTLEGADWPNNVRELKNAIEHAVSTGDTGVIEVEDLPEYLQAFAEPADPRRAKLETSNLPSLDEAEGQLIRATLEHFRGNKVRAALSLGISRHKLYDRLKKLGIP